MRLAILVVGLLSTVALAESPPTITVEESERLIREWNEANPGLQEGINRYRTAIDDMCRNGRLGEAYYGLDADEKAGILELGELVELFERVSPNGTREDACQRALRHQMTNMIMGKG